MLTIGFPTYNRSQQIGGLLSGLCRHLGEGQSRLLVVDDGSNDDTHRELQERAARCDVLEIVLHQSNEGYAVRLTELFDRCQTPYLLVTSDDDSVKVEQLAPLLKELRRGRADVLSTQFLHQGSVYRGKKRFSAIAPRDFFACSAHAPGIVYKVDACRAGVAEVRRLLAESSEVARVYPQVIVVASVLATGAGYWWPYPMVETGAGLPTGLRSTDGGSYYSVAARWRQLKEFEGYFSEKLSEVTAPQQKTIIEQMRQANRARIYGTLRAAVELELPETLEEFDRSVRRHCLRLHGKTLLSAKAVSFFSRH
jgi:glycosyltransferase involved in cell wall biosynthesis